MNSNFSRARSWFDSLPDSGFIRQRQLLEVGIVPYSAATLWRKCRSHQFPAPIKVSAAITAWRCGDIRDWQRNPSAYKAPDAAKGSASKPQKGVAA